MTRIAVLGPGGVGGFVAAALTRAGNEVTVVAHEATAQRIAADGIAVQSVRIGDFVAHPAALARLEHPVDLLVVATKATTLEAALDRVGAEPALVVPLLNGFEHIAVLRATFGAQSVPAGAIRIESDRPEPARIVQTSPFLRIDLAADDPQLHAKLPPVAELFEQAEIPVRIGKSEADVIWAKLVRLNALACTTSASGRRLGFIRSDPQWRQALLACIEEATAVANAEGASLPAAQPLAELEDAHAELGSSMQRDIEAGREPELDAIPGAVLRAAHRHGLQCPTIAELTARIAERAGVPTPTY